MNCSQLLERRTATNWERPAQTTRTYSETPEPKATDSYRWSAVRFSSVGQTLRTASPRPLRRRTEPRPARAFTLSANGWQPGAVSPH